MSDKVRRGLHLAQLAHVRQDAAATSVSNRQQVVGQRGRLPGYQSPALLANAAHGGGAAILKFYPTGGIVGRLALEEGIFRLRP